MDKKFLFFAGIIILAIACNENSETKNTTKPDTVVSSGEHDHAAVTTPSTDIPEVPAIPDGARVYFKNLKEGSMVKAPFKVEMGVDKMSLDTANGKIKPASGHHHILIGYDSIPAGMAVPKDSTHLHFGNAQSATEITLVPGKYKLTLQFADALHRSYGSKLTSSINITVKK